MLLKDITKIVRALLTSFGAATSQDEFTQRRVAQIGEVIGAVEDVTYIEGESNFIIGDKRVEEACGIIHRVAAILAIEEAGSGGGGNGEKENGAGDGDDEPLAEVPWDGSFDGETIVLKEDEE